MSATILSALFLALGWVLERPAFGLPALLSILTYSLAYISGGYLRVKAGLAALHHGVLNIDMLMVLGAVGAALLGRWGEGAVLIFLFALSNTLEGYAAGRTRNAIGSLVALGPESALVRRPDGREERIPVEQLTVGDLVLVRPGERFPADGQVTEGRSAVDQSPITGESIPVEKGPGSQIFAGTLNGSGLLAVRATRLATDSTLSRVIRLVEEAQEHKAKSQRIVDWVDRYYTLLVVAVSLVTFLVPPLAGGWAWSKSFYLSMQLLVVMSPCALVIATPAALLSAIAAGARRGLLFKGGVHLEAAGQISVVAFDKTGTLTEGKPLVQAVLPAPGFTETELLRLAAAAETRSGHPLGQAVLAEARQREISLPAVTAVREQPGYGITATVEGNEVRIGSHRLVQDDGSGWLSAQVDALESRGQTAILVQADQRLAGVIGVADTLRDGVPEMIAALRRFGIQRVVMLTGDNPRVAAAIARQAGIDEFRASLLPEDKLTAIRDLQAAYGGVAMVGDGINDAPALALATLGVAMGGAENDAALESADVVLMGDDILRLPDAFRLGRQARRVVVQNLTFAIGVILILVALSLAGKLPLPLAVVGHEGSTILVAMNGMRLLFTRWVTQGRRSPVLAHSEASL